MESPVHPWTIEVSGKGGGCCLRGPTAGSPRSALSVTCTLRDRLGVSESLLLSVYQALMFDLGGSALVRVRPTAAPLHGLSNTKSSMVIPAVDLGGTPVRRLPWQPICRRWQAEACLGRRPSCAWRFARFKGLRLASRLLARRHLDDGVGTHCSVMRRSRDPRDRRERMMNVERETGVSRASTSGSHASEFSYRFGAAT